jgi:hypothetical protein
LTFGPIIRALFGADNHNAPLYMMVGGIFILMAALSAAKVTIVPAECGDDAGLLGAARLAFSANEESV